jgi:hypothetical protein
MTLDHQRPYFNMTIAACRRAGAIGGHRSARNRTHQRQVDQLEEIQVHLETAAEAIALLDAQFPWLRGVERRAAR